jgi:hypothetical protein
VTLISNYSAIERKLAEALDIPIKMMMLWRIFKISFLFSERGEHLRVNANIDGFTSAEQSLFYRELVH